jgi:hypothetical protein
LTVVPQGTLSAIAATTATYLLFVWLFGCILSNKTLIGDKLVEMRIAWPTPYLVAIGTYTYILIYHIHSIILRSRTVY